MRNTGEYAGIIDGPVMGAGYARETEIDTTQEYGPSFGTQGLEEYSTIAQYTLSWPAAERYHSLPCPVIQQQPQGTYATAMLK